MQFCESQRGLNATVNELYGAALYIDPHNCNIAITLSFTKDIMLEGFSRQTKPTEIKACFFPRIVVRPVNVIGGNSSLTGGFVGGDVGDCNPKTFRSTTALYGLAGGLSDVVASEQTVSTNRIPMLVSTARIIRK